MAFLMTHSLLSAWLYSMQENPFADATTEDTAKEDFLRVLRREPTPTTEAMQKGIDFENLVTDICQKIEPMQGLLLTGQPPEEEDALPEELKKHQWFNPALKVAKIVLGGQFQYSAYQRVEIDRYELLLHGRLDALKAGHIYDIKFSGSYDRGKYFGSTQHPMYLDLVPEAVDFTYLISDGANVWTEKYRRDETQSIYPVIRDFLQWLTATGLIQTYLYHWGERK